MNPYEKDPNLIKSVYTDNGILIGAIVRSEKNPKWFLAKSIFHPRVPGQAYDSMEAAEWRVKERSIWHNVTAAANALRGEGLDPWVDVVGGDVCFMSWTVTVEYDDDDDHDIVIPNITTTSGIAEMVAQAWAEMAEKVPVPVRLDWD